MAQKRKSTGQDQEQDTVPSLLGSACTFGVEGMVTKRRGITKCVVETFGTLTQVGYLTDTGSLLTGYFLSLDVNTIACVFSEKPLTSSEVQLVLATTNSFHVKWDELPTVERYLLQISPELPVSPGAGKPAHFSELSTQSSCISPYTAPLHLLQSGLSCSHNVEESKLQFDKFVSIFSAIFSLSCMIVYEGGHCGLQ